MSDLRQLPDGWRWVELGTICRQDRTIIQVNGSISPLPYLGLEHVESQTGRILREPAETIADEGTSTTFAFDQRHVLYSKLRPYLNKVALPEYAGRCTTEMIPLLPTAVDRVFLAWMLRRSATVAVAMQNRTGSRMPRADMDDLMRMLVPLPSTVDEQHRIAERIEAYMAEIAAARAAAEAELSAAEELAAAYLREVFESDEAQGWEMKPVAQFARVTGGIQKQPSRSPQNFFRPYLTVRNVQRGWLDLARVENFEISPAELERYRLMDGDILIVEGNGSLDHIGRCALFHDELEDCIHQNHIIRIRVDPDQANPHFAALYLNSANGKVQMIDKARTSSGLYTLSVSKVQSLEIPLPSPKRQAELVELTTPYLSEVDALRNAIHARLERIEQLPTAVLEQAFSGEL